MSKSLKSSLVEAFPDEEHIDTEVVMDALDDDLDEVGQNAWDDCATAVEKLLAEKLPAILAKHGLVADPQILRVIEASEPYFQIGFDVVEAMKSYAAVFVAETIEQSARHSVTRPGK